MWQAEFCLCCDSNDDDDNDTMYAYRSIMLLRWEYFKNILRSINIGFVLISIIKQLFPSEFSWECTADTSHELRMHALPYCIDLSVYNTTAMKIWILYEKRSKYHLYS